MRIGSVKALCALASRQHALRADPKKVEAKHYRHVKQQDSCCYGAKLRPFSPHMFQETLPILPGPSAGDGDIQVMLAAWLSLVIY